MALIEAKVIVSCFLLHYRIELNEAVQLKMQGKFLYGPVDDNLIRIA
jgi:hypothetical protein